MDMMCHETSFEQVSKDQIEKRKTQLILCKELVITQASDVGWTF